MLRLAGAVLAWTALLASTGCPKPQPSAWKPGGVNDQGYVDSPHSDAVNDQAKLHDAGMAISLFKDTPMEASPPDGISFGRSCRMLYVHGFDTTQQVYYLAQFELADGKLTPQPLFLRKPDLIIPYLSSAPDGSECLVMSQYQKDKKDFVKDVIYRAGGSIPVQFDNRSAVPYEAVAGLPKGDFDTYFLTKPFYSWDGTEIIEPLNDGGLAIMSVRTGTGRYVAYPSLTGGPAVGRALGALPDSGGKHRIWLSQWVQGIKSDICEVQLLDLASGKWERAFGLTWTATAIAGGVDGAPFLVSGTFPGQEGSEDNAAPLGAPDRVPRLARITAGSDDPDLLELYGEPVWTIALDPKAGYAFYMDKRHHALARIEPASGKLDSDNRWYSPDIDTQLFISEGGDTCLAWKRDVLVQAAWGKHEDFKGYDEGE